MTLLEGLEVVIREYRGKGVNRLCDAILTWWRKKKLSSDEFRKLRRSYLNSRWPEADVETQQEWALTKTATNAEIASSLARLALDDDNVDDESDRGDEQVSACKQWLADELNDLRRNQEKAMKNLFDNFEQKIVGMMNKFTEQLTSRLEKAENQIEALKIHNVEQAEKILKLEEKMVVFEDAQEREEREKRICNLVVEGLPVENKTQEDALAVVNEFLVTKLETEVHPTAVVRLRNPSHGNGKLKLLIKFKDVSDKVLVLRNCKKLKAFPDIRVWEDLTPKQQANRRAQMPKLRSLRQEGKIAFFRADRLYVAERQGERPVLLTY